jgi:hypothetical protein
LGRGKQEDLNDNAVKTADYVTRMNQFFLWWKYFCPSTSSSCRFYCMQDQVAIIVYKYINDFDFNSTNKMKTHG